MKKKDIAKFPKDFFHLKRPIINASKVLKNVIPIKWKKNFSSSYVNKIK